MVYLSKTLVLSECHPTADHRGPYWLYDKVQGMNLAMGADTPQDALVKALTYYQNRLLEVERAYKELGAKVDAINAILGNEESP
jgi:hypothetical protein